MVAHHYRVLKEEEVGAAPEFLDLGKRARGRCLRSERNEFRELKFVLRNILRLTVVATLAF